MSKREFYLALITTSSPEVSFILCETGWLFQEFSILKARSGMKTDLTSLDRSVTENWIHFVFEPSWFFSSTFLFSPPFIHSCIRILVSCQIVCMSICLSVHSYILFITQQILTVFQSINLYMTAKKFNLLHKLICHLIVPYPVDIRQHL